MLKVLLAIAALIGVFAATALHVTSAHASAASVASEVAAIRAFQDNLGPSADISTVPLSAAFEHVVLVEGERPDDDPLVEWIAFVDESLQRPEFTIRPEFAKDFEVLFGVVRQASRFGMAFLTLRESGMIREAEAVARAAMEHAVTAHWVFFTKGGLDRFVVAVNANFRSYYRVMAEWLEYPDLTSKVEAVSEVTGSGMPNFTQIMTDFGGKFLTTTYKSLSLSVHPTHHTVLKYLEHSEGRIEVRNEARDPTPFPALYITAIASMLTLSLIEYMTDPEAVAEKLDEPSERLRLPMFLHDELPNSKKRVLA